jgi:hypothetical protein
MDVQPVVQEPHRTQIDQRAAAMPGQAGRLPRRGQCLLQYRHPVHQLLSALDGPFGAAQVGAGEGMGDVQVSAAWALVSKRPHALISGS